MARSGNTKDINTQMHRAGNKGYIQWDDGSISYYETRAQAKREVRRK